MKIKDVTVGQNVKVEFSTHGREWAMEGEVKDIMPNAIRINDQLLNVAVITNIQPIIESFEPIEAINQWYNVQGVSV